MQTTTVDQAAGIITLTTVLAHSSGEWIASDWPVCAISDTATPHHMGAALTYARRYALFTLVGIASEDDIDAPDLNPAPAPTAASGPSQAAPNGDKRLNGGPPRSAPRQTRNGGERGPRMDLRPSRPLLDPKASSALRDRLAADLRGIGSAAEAAAWAYRVLGAKGTLVAADAEHIEAIFRQKLTEFDGPGGAGNAARSAPANRLNRAPPPASTRAN